MFQTDGTLEVTDSDAWCTNVVDGQCLHIVTFLMVALARNKKQCGFT